jgi:hypothetical protein
MRSAKPIASRGRHFGDLRALRPPRRAASSNDRANFFSDLTGLSDSEAFRRVSSLTSLATMTSSSRDCGHDR